MLAGIAREIDGAVLLLGHTARSPKAASSPARAGMGCGDPLAPDCCAGSRRRTRRGVRQLSLARPEGDDARRPDEVPLIWARRRAGVGSTRGIWARARNGWSSSAAEIEQAFLLALDGKNPTRPNLSARAPGK